MNQSVLIHRPCHAKAFAGVNDLQVLSDLIGTAGFNLELEAQYCLAHFKEIDWCRARGLDCVRFNELHTKGMAGCLTRSELDELVSMLSLDRPLPVYALLVKALKLCGLWEPSFQ